MFVGENPIHIKTESRDDIAPLVLMPGDPLRAKYIAENFLKDAKLVTSVRNMFGYTGTYKGTRVTVMGSGMGMPSMSIYAFELFHFYNVQRIIRIGTCGVVNPSVKVPELILADSVYSETNFDYTYDSNHRGIVYPNKDLNKCIMAAAQELKINLHIGNIITCDCFGPYINMQPVLDRIPKLIEPLGEEMEAYALCLIGNEMKRQTACIVTAVDSIYSDVVLTPEEREQSLNDMINVALEAVIK